MSEMSMMASRSPWRVSFFAFSLRISSEVLALSISLTSEPMEQTTSNSWASPRPVTRVDSVSIEPGRWRISILL